MSLADPRATLVSKSQHRGLCRLQDATSVRGVPAFGRPWPARRQSPSVRGASGCTGHSCTSSSMPSCVTSVKRVTMTQIKNQNTQRQAAAPRTLGPAWGDRSSCRGGTPARAPDTRNRDYNSRHPPGRIGGAAPAAHRAACRES